MEVCDQQLRHNATGHFLPNIPGCMGNSKFFSKNCEFFAVWHVIHLQATHICMMCDERVDELCQCVSNC